MKAETISTQNLKPLAALFVEMFSVDSFEDEYKLCSEILHNENQTCFLLKDNQEYIAFIYLALRTDFVEGARSSPVAYVEAVYVRQTHRKTGAGRKLIQIAEDWAKQKGCTQLASDTEIKNTGSIKFHKRTGFSETNRIVCFLKDLK